MLLVIDRKNTHIKHSSGVLHIYHQDKLQQRASLKLLEKLIIYGNPSIDCQVWRALAEHNVVTVIVSSRGKQNTAFLGEGLAMQLPIRRLQFRCAEHKETATDIARWVLVKKFLAYELPIMLLEAQQGKNFSAFKASQKKSLEQLHQQSQIENFIGTEGNLAKSWFALLAEILPDSWKFSGRNRRPPQDPVNALLSLTYTMALTDIRQVLLEEGLDTSFGFLHQPEAGREALVLDVLEIFRSVLDVFVLDSLSLFQPEHFYYRKQEGCRLGKEARPIYYKAWAEFRKNCPRPLRKQQALEEWPVAPLREQIRGQVQQLRKIMEWLEDVEKT
jgi:CRISPR-associated protein Cas1